MRTATFAKLVLTASVGIGSLFTLATPAQADPPAKQGTVVLDKAPPPTTSTTLVLQAEPFDPTPHDPDLPLAAPSDDPVVDPEPGEDGSQPAATCAPTPGAEECDDTPDPECVPDSTQQDPWSHCEEDCEPIPGGPDPCPDEECPDGNDPAPRAQIPPTGGPEDCEDPECPEPGTHAARAQVPPTGHPEDCDDPECPEPGDAPPRTQAPPTTDPDDCDDPECPEPGDEIARIRGQEGPRPEDCDEPECPRPTDGPTRSLGADREDCDHEEPCVPKPGEDDSCKLPRTGAEMSTYVAAGAGLTGVGAALNGLKRRIRRRRG